MCATSPMHYFMEVDPGPAQGIVMTSVMVVCSSGLMLAWPCTAAAICLKASNYLISYGIPMTIQCEID